MLLAGGYFRARLPTLSAFDKVVGGMVWSLTASGSELDVDIIFTENSTIGQRIKLADQLVKALVKIRCPHPLQSHQIQGLDYDHLFPVIQWLVRRVIEHRRLTGDLVRAQSLASFDKSYALPEEQERLRAEREALKDAAKPTRKFRKKASAAFDTVQARTDATLLEYGERIQSLAALGEDEEKEAKAAERGGQRNALINKFEKERSGSTAAEKDAAARAELEKRETERLEALRGQLSEVGAGKVSGANVGNLVGLQSDEIRKAAASYEEMMRKQEEEGKRGQDVAFTRQMEALKRKIQQQKEMAEKNAAAAAEREAAYSALAARVAKEERRIAKIDAETAKLEALENDSANKEVLAQLRSLVQLNEQLKAQEQAFKESCARQRQEMKEQLARLDPSSSTATSGDDEEVARLKAVETMYTSEMDQLQRLRRVLARKNQEVAHLSRKIDEVPTRAELLQYERRFVELYELSAEKHSETKKFYDMYNATNQCYEFMQTEVKLLNSIIEGYPAAVIKGSPASRADFLNKLEQILQGVAANKEHVAKEQTAAEAQKEALQLKLNALLDKQRAYFKAVKLFQEECFKNEQLQLLWEKYEAGGNQQAIPEGNEEE